MRLSFIDSGMVSCSVSLWAVLGTFAVIFPLLGGFNCQPFVLVSSLTANLSCWLVLIHCNLFSLSSGVLAAILLVHEYFSAEIFLSPQGFHLPFFRVHGYFSACCSLASPSFAVSEVSAFLHVVAE